jgi:hypothetical protein
MAVNKRTSGQTLVEFALVLLLLLVLVMALFDIGRAILFYAVLNTAAREGTRFAVVQDYQSFGGETYQVSCSAEDKKPGDTNICSEVEDKFFNIAALSDSTITIQHFDDGKTEPDEYFVIIDIAYDFKPVTPGLNLIGDFTIEVSSQMIKTPVAKP